MPLLGSFGAAAAKAEGFTNFVGTTTSLTVRFSTSTFDVTLTTSVTYPSGIVAGDLILLYLICADINSATPPTITPPAGFTSIGTGTSFSIDNLNADTSSAYYRLATGTETGAITWSKSAGDYPRSIITVFRPSKTISIITPTAFTSQGVPNGTGGVTNPSNQTIPMAAGPLIMFAKYDNDGGGSISISGFTPTEDGNVTASTDSILKYKIYNYTSAATTVSHSSGGSGTDNILSSFYLKLA
jgi:hypothetical protein